MSTRSDENLSRLLGIALAQGGFFTATQAAAAGYADSQHVYHVKHGNWEKAMRGIYRLAVLPPHPNPALCVATLWTRDREGRIEGAISHETAVALHGLGPATDAIHITVPRLFRRNSEPPPGVRVHREDLPASEIETRDGYRLVTPACALRQTGATPAVTTATTDYQHVINAGED